MRRQPGWWLVRRRLRIRRGPRNWIRCLLEHRRLRKLLVEKRLLSGEVRLISLSWRDCFFVHHRWTIILHNGLGLFVWYPDWYWLGNGSIAGTIIEFHNVAGLPRLDSSIYTHKRICSLRSFLGSSPESIFVVEGRWTSYLMAALLHRCLPCQFIGVAGRRTPHVQRQDWAWEVKLRGVLNRVGDVSRRGIQALLEGLILRSGYCVPIGRVLVACLAIVEWTSGPGSNLFRVILHLEFF